MIALRKGSNRNTQCHEVCIGAHTFYFSYQTCVAYSGPCSKVNIRLANHWGPTTGRHMSDMGVKEWAVVSDEVFDDIIAAATSPA